MRNNTPKYILILFMLLSQLACGSDDGPSSSLTGPDSPAEAQGMDGETLEAGIQEIRKGTYGEVHSLLVVRNGVFVVEEYFEGWERNDVHAVYSVSKSITSMLTGVALEQGILEDLDSKLLPYFPEYQTYANYDTLKSEINLHNVLTMHSGFQWDENLIGPEKGDWIKFVLDMPMSEPPGTQFRYNSGTTLSMSGVLQNLTGELLSSFADENLFRPAGIRAWSWGLIRRVGLPNFTDASGGLNLRPYDMVNIGMLMLQKGKRGGVQIIPEAWVELSTGKRVSANSNFDYGYWWWRFSDSSRIGSSLAVNDVYWAWGALGQFIFVIPHLQLVVVSTQHNLETTGRETFDLLHDYILASIKD